MQQQDINRTPQFKVAVLISGRGSNLGSLIKNARNYSISEVISNKPDAPGLDLARAHSIPVTAFSRAEGQKLSDFKDAIFRHVLELDADLVCLAGFMMVVPAEITKRLEGKLINIHPSLLPKYPGLDTHKRALAGKEQEHGCTVHFVDAGVDSGPTIAQAKLSVKNDETEESLSSRVLQLEHVIYPWTINNIASGKITLRGGKVVISKSLLESAREHSLILPL